MSIYDLDTERSREAERRLCMLGDLVNYEYDYDRLRVRARAVDIPLRVLRDWQRLYQAQGLEGLQPHDWTELGEQTQRIVQQRREQLGALADVEIVLPAQIAQLGERLGWTYRRTGAWLRRYRAGGLWVLAPQNNPDKRRGRKKVERDLGALDNAALEEAHQRLQILGDLAQREMVSEAEVKARAQEAGVSARTIWNYLKAYRQFGMKGLVRQRRADKGKRHIISERMVEVIRGIRLSKLDYPSRAVYEAACEKARLLGEPEPSEWQVRDICKRIPKADKLLADKRYNEFRNKYRFTHRMRFDGARIIYQIDHTPIDVLVKDIRKPAYRTVSGEVRPWLTLSIDSSSRLAMSARFGYDAPNRFTVAAAIRDSLLVSEDKPYGGIPDEIWVDHGKELLANHVWQLTQELGIMLQPCAPGQPQIRGIGERFFETLNTRLWATLPGYVASNTVERNPNAKAALTLSELVAEFWAFIERYHAEEHSETGKSPLDYWMEHCFAEAVDPRQLDILLKEPVQRTVQKVGINYYKRVYWHTGIGDLVGVGVLVRAEPSYMAPDEIEVFHSDEWICTAIATDSEAGLQVTRQQVAAAQREQRSKARQRINKARQTLKEAEREIEELHGGVPAPDPSQKTPGHSRDGSEVKPPKRSRKRQQTDFLDRLAGLAE